MTQLKLHDRPLVFDQQQTQMLDRCLLRLADRTAAPLVMLADVSGRLLIYRGRLSAMQSTGLAALAAGGFAAASEIGSFLGLRDGFQQQLLEGSLANLYIVRVGPEMLLIVAYTGKTTLGMVRIFSQQAQQELLVLVKAAVKAREEMTVETPELEEGFNEALKQQLDDLFAEDLG